MDPLVERDELYLVVRAIICPMWRQTLLDNFIVIPILLPSRERFIRDDYRLFNEDRSLTCGFHPLHPAVLHSLLKCFTRSKIVPKFADFLFTFFGFLISAYLAWMIMSVIPSLNYSYALLFPICWPYKVIYSVWNVYCKNVYTLCKLSSSKQLH